VAGSATEARTGRLDTADRRLRWRNRVDGLAGEDLRPEKVGIESVEREEDEDELEPWLWEMALVRRACESVRDEVEAMAYTEREIERERGGVGESELGFMCERERERERERVRLRISFPSTRQENDDR
jgi:hypothetical protein